MNRPSARGKKEGGEGGGEVDVNWKEGLSTFPVFLEHSFSKKTAPHSS